MKKVGFIVVDLKSKIILLNINHRDWMIKIFLYNQILDKLEWILLFIEI